MRRAVMETDIDANLWPPRRRALADELGRGGAGQGAAVAAEVGLVRVAGVGGQPGQPGARVGPAQREEALQPQDPVWSVFGP